MLYVVCQKCEREIPVSPNNEIDDVIEVEYFKCKTTFDGVVQED
jgi:hypothetical protein